MTILDLNKQEVTAVRCGAEVVPDAVTSVAGTAVGGPATTMPDPALPTTVLPP